MTKFTNVLYYKGNQKGEKMFTILLTLLACGEEKIDDSAAPVVEEQEEIVEDTSSAE